MPFFIENYEDRFRKTERPAAIIEYDTETDYSNSKNIDSSRSNHQPTRTQKQTLLDLKGHHSKRSTNHGNFFAYGDQYLP